LSLPERAHILDCEECRVALKTCLRTKTFAAVLKELNQADGEKAG
jgi:hypothetical protein